MEHLIAAAFCILALVAGSHAQGPNLSPSFSFEGSAVSTITSGPTDLTFTYTQFDLAIDATRELQAMEFASTFSGQQIMQYTILSINDGMQYTVTNNVCNAISTDMTMNSSLDYWSFFDNAVENPPGTYTVNVSTVILTLVTVNGLPTSLNTTVPGQSNIITITSYINSTPPFSTFTLPEACENYTCNSCYSSGAVARGSLLLLIIAIALLFSAM